MGRAALAMALKPPASRPRRRSTGHTLIVRDSTGPAPARAPAVVRYAGAVLARTP
jgi:LacI family transcriptional regulator